MNSSIRLECDQRFNVDLREIESTRLYGDCRSKFADRCIKGIHSYCALDRDARSGQVACSSAIACDGERINVVLIGACIELREMNERAIVRLRSEIAIARDSGKSRPHAMRKGIDGTNARVLLEQRARRFGFIALTNTRATQQDFREIAVLRMQGQECARSRVIEFDLRHRIIGPVVRAQVESLRTRHAYGSAPRLRNHGEPLLTRLFHRVFRSRIAFDKFLQEFAQRRLRIKSPRTHFLRGPCQKLSEELGARHRKRGAHRFIFAHTVGV